jgi:type IX secretion system PorP/SprF family membrane protein
MRNILIILFLIPSLVEGQSYSFSQFFSTPLALNPALNGSAYTRLRLSGNFRNQWVYGGTPYLTGSLGVETKILANSIPDFHSWGVCSNVIIDQSNAGGLTYTISSVGTAYHIALDAEGSQTIGLGIQGSFNQRSINLNRLSFESQFASGGFNNSIPIGETFQNLSKNYMDIHSGLLYQFKKENVQITFGGALYNILAPKTNSTLTEYRLPKRYVLHTAFNTNIGEGLGIMGSLTGMSVSGLNNLTAGVALRKDLETISLTGGCWYRVGDALIPYVGFGINGLTIGLSFDNTISSLKSVAQTRNAFELGIMFTPMGEYQKMKKSVPWY